MTQEYIKAQLGSRKKYSNKQEYRYIPTASAVGITVEGDGELMPRLAQRLIASGKPADCLLSAYRGDMGCLKPFTLTKWASGTVGRGEQPKQFQKKESNK